MQEHIDDSDNNISSRRSIECFTPCFFWQNIQTFVSSRFMHHDYGPDRKANENQIVTAGTEEV